LHFIRSIGRILRADMLALGLFERPRRSAVDAADLLVERIGIVTGGDFFDRSIVRRSRQDQLCGKISG